jgi:hypothetical protein
VTTSTLQRHPQLLRGKARMREIAAAAEVERKSLATELLAGLGRPATAVDQIAAETISAATVRARRLRAVGRSDADGRAGDLTVARLPSAVEAPVLNDLLGLRRRRRT